MKKIVVSTVLAASVVFPLTSYADSFPQNLEVSKSALVRTGATTNYQVITSLDSGEDIKVVGEFINSLGEKWFRVDVNGKLGWTQAVNFGDTTSLDVKAFVNEDNVHVRRGTSTSYDIVDKLMEDKEVTILDEHLTASQETWYQIAYDGKIGWMYGTFLTKVEKPTTSGPEQLEKDMVVNTSNTKMHTGATTEYKIVTTLNEKQIVHTVSKFTNSLGESWYQVEVNANRGWINAKYLSDVEENNPPSPEETNSIIQVQKAEIRTGASSAYKIIKYAYLNESYVIIDTFNNSLGEKWFRVKVGDSAGWIKSSSFEKKQDVSTKTVTIEKAEIRTGASSAYKVIQYAYENEDLKVVGEFSNSLGEKWYQIDLVTTKGWINEKAFLDALPPTPENPDSNEYKFTVGAIVYSKLDQTNVHSGATSSYKIVTKLNVNSPVNVVDFFTNSLGEKWIKVQISPSLIGWVKENELSNNKALGYPLYISVDVANLRSGPSLSNEVVNQGAKGEKFTAISSTKDSDGDTWYEISKDSNVYWAHESVVSKTETLLNEVRTIKLLNSVIRSGANYSYPITKYLAYGNKVTLLKEYVNASNEKWYQVKAESGETGWMSEYDVQVGYPVGYANKDGVALRRGASTSYSAESYLKLNDEVKVIRELNGWKNVETLNGTRGWMLSSDISAISMKQLSSPVIKNLWKESTITWSKTSDFHVTYARNTFNSIKIYGDMTSIQIPNESTPGVEKAYVSIAADGTKVLYVTFKPGYTFTLREYSDRLSLKVMPLGLPGKKIIIDAGHGGKDTGAVGYSGLYEKEVVLDTAIKLKAELERQGATVLLTRDTDVFLELYERTDIANDSDYDAFVSIHGDSHTTTSRGSTTYYNKSVNFNGPKSYDLGLTVQNNLVSNIGTYNRGVQEQLFYVNRKNELPSILVELAFLSNPTEEARMKTQEFRINAAKGIANGLKEYFSTP
ncbi:SH3 domain-containing protein [Rossellomorea aquimaris]|uniref:SH3 domain-containing protein n=1 Tax=Rossellomorea aquimaris TaxID=189382 RepID=UPI0009ED6E01|nr:SH3 domain-containing protein [Rossellomorea aquimaris]